MNEEKSALKSHLILWSFKFDTIDVKNNLSHDCSTTHLTGLEPEIMIVSKMMKIFLFLGKLNLNYNVYGSLKCMKTS